MCSDRNNREAIVIGASMGGLLAARALADHYAQVTLLERDALPPPGANRKGVPQGLHAHGLLARGREVLEQLFPGLTAALVAQGAEPGDVGETLRWFHQGAYHRATASGMEGLAVSRPMLEAEVRARLLARPNVRLLAQCDVLGLEADASHSRVTGVRLIRRAADSAAETLHADLVIDATGRGSRSPAWLTDTPAPDAQAASPGRGLRGCTGLRRRITSHRGRQRPRAGIYNRYCFLTRPTHREVSMRLLLRWLVTAAALFITAMIVPGINVTDQNGWLAVFVMAAVFGLVNAFIRPILTLLSCPLVLLTLGLFTLVINGLCLWLSAWIAQNWFGAGFTVDGFWPALFGGIVVGIVSFLLSMFLPDQNESSRRKA